MNLLQSIDEKANGPVLVTLNPPFEPKKELIAGEWSYDHPLYTEKVSGYTTSFGLALLTSISSS